jgi:uncharacterized protein (TIGR02391 family)
MNLETQISSILWNSIKNNYDNKNYTGAIKDSIYYLSNIIRDKSGLESDGIALISQAFGKNPKIKVNSLQTESEKNVQLGIEHLLRGIYTAIRNPRSHDKYEDNARDADAIIIFIDYLIGILDKSKSQFSEMDYLNKVFDKNFVGSERYAKLLVAEIPSRQVFNIILKVYKQRESGNEKIFNHFITELLKKLKDEEVTEFFKIVSDEMICMTTDISIRTTIQFIPMEYWNKVSEISRLRVESILIESVEEGKYNVSDGVYGGGSLGTWLAFGKVKYLTLKDQLLNVLIDKLDSFNADDQDYVFRYFIGDILDIESPSALLQRTISNALSYGDKRFYNALEDIFLLADDDNKWVQAFQKYYYNFSEEVAVTQVYEEGDIPF